MDLLPRTARLAGHISRGGGEKAGQREERRLGEEGEKVRLYMIKPVGRNAWQCCDRSKFGPGQNMMMHYDFEIEQPSLGPLAPHPSFSS